MAVYERDADPATAVNAFLAQYTIAANGDIRFDTGSDTFHVWWLHRALQKKAWEQTVDAGSSDFILLSSPNPSTSEALGTIITLINHTTNFSVRYNIDDTVAQGLFGGSVEQEDASGNNERYAGLIVLGTTENTTTLQILQNGALLTNFWGTGLNAITNVLLRILVKSQEGAGGAIDGERIIVKASEFGDTYAIWETTLGLGESVASITTVSDPQNDTLLATVQAYTGYAGVASTLEGYQLIDVDGNGADPFIGAASYAGLTGNQNKKALFEVVKAYLARGTTDTIFGIDGDLWTGRVFDVNVSSGSGTWVQNESVTWGTGATAGTGTFMAADNLAGASTTVVYLHLDTGVPPDNSTTLSGATGSNAVTSATRRATQANWLGVFTGSNWIGANGVGFAGSELIFGDSVTALNGQQPTVPQNVSLTVNVTCDNGDDPYVFLAEKDPVLDAPDYDKYTASSGTSGGTTLTLGTSIDVDEPGTGYVGILHDGDTAYTFYEYSSYSGAVFTLTGSLNGGTLNANVVGTEPVFIAYFYEAATGTGTSQSVSRSFVFDAGTRDFIGWVRHGDPAIPDKPVPIAFNGVGSNSLALTVVLENES